MTVVLDASRFGWGSREWILKQAISHAPTENKDLTLQSLVAYLAHAESTTTVELLDIITQGVLTGSYTPTVRMTDLPKPKDPGYPEHDNPENDLDPITEREIEDFMEEMSEYPDAKDPFDD